MGLSPAAQIRQVLLFRNVGLGHNDTTVATGMGHQMAQHFHQLMRLRTVNAVGVRLFPDETHGIESNPAHAMGQLLFQQAHESQQHFWMPPVHIHLIRTKRGPHLTLAGRALQAGEQCGTAGAHD